MFYLYPKHYFYAKSVAFNYHKAYLEISLLQQICLGKLVRCYKIPVGYSKEDLVICEHTGTLSLFVRLYLTTHEFFQHSYKGNTILNFISNYHRFYYYWITRYHKVQQFLSLSPLYFISLYCFYIKNSYHFSCNRRLCSRLLFSSNPSYEYYIFSESVFLCKREYNTFIPNDINKKDNNVIFKKPFL